MLPISDGLVDRLSGFIPPAWPAGPSRTFLPGAGPVADESVPMLWGGFRMTAVIVVDDVAADGVIYALGDWFGGYALFATGGIVSFAFARAVDTLELTTRDALAPGHHEIAVTYALGTDGAPGRMALEVDGAQVDRIEVTGILPIALQHGGAGLRLGRDTGFPVSPAYSPPAPFTGTVHQLRIETPGASTRDRVAEVRTALHAD